MEAFILIGDGFDESSVIDCLCKVRDQRLSVSLVGLYAGILRGCRGVTIQPDLSLSQLEQQMRTQALHRVIILSGCCNMPALLSDPRVHRLVEHTLNGTGLVAVMSSQSEWPLRTYHLSPSAEINLLTQDRMETAHFVEEIIRRIQFSITQYQCSLAKQ